MPALLDRLTHEVSRKLRAFGFSSPSSPVLDVLFQTAYLASLKTEEGRFVRPSITFADPRIPELAPPYTRRADYPQFSRLAHRVPLTVEALVKMSRAVNEWSGSIAVFGTRKADVVAWGIVDQLVQQNVRLNRESEGGFDNPGILTVVVDGVGELSGYHGTVFLGALRGHKILFRENDALRSRVLASRIRPALMPAAAGIANSLGEPGDTRTFLDLLYEAWARTVSRLCIGLRRLGSGGSLIMSTAPVSKSLDITHRFDYPRLGDSMILQVLDQWHLYKTSEHFNEAEYGESMPSDLHYRIHRADADALDRESEVTGAVKLVTSLAAADGVVLLTPTLHLRGFGVKIGPGPNVNKVYDGPDFVRKGTRAKTIDPTDFGTRHRSMLRYCRLDQSAVGVVVSQDGHVRIVMSSGRSVMLWNDVKLLGHKNYSIAVARAEKKWRAARRSRRFAYRLGYTEMPKTLSELLGAAKGRLA